MLFPERRSQPWLRTRGLVFVGFIFLVGAFLAWFLWTQIARPVKFHVPPYHPPALLLGIGAAVSVLLAISAYGLRGSEQVHAVRKAPHPVVIGLMVFVIASAWYVLITLVFASSLRPHFSFWYVVLIGIVWAAMAFTLLRRWSSASGWGDFHRFTAASAGTLVCMAAGFSGSSIWPRIDVIAKVVFNVVAVAALVALGGKFGAGSATVLLV